jgi:hypothetical protein
MDTDPQILVDTGHNTLLMDLMRAAFPRNNPEERRPTFIMGIPKNHRPKPVLNKDGIPTCSWDRCPHMKGGLFQSDVGFPRDFVEASGHDTHTLKQLCGISHLNSPCLPVITAIGHVAAAMNKTLEERMAITVGGPIYKKITKLINNGEKK